MDIDRLETLKEEYGSRYVSPDFWDRIKQADEDLADKVYVQKQGYWSLIKGLFGEKQDES